MAIQKPENMNFSQKNITMLISGLPGVGKTTVALSAPDVLLIDTDEGMCRVNPAHRKDASICKTYEEVLADIEAAKGHYKSLVIDTCGALIDCLKDWAMRTDPKASRKDGGFSLQGYGTIKSEFVRLSAMLRKNFNVVFLFHENKTKDGDDTFYDLVVEGATKTLVWQPADLGAHLCIVGGKRMMCFTPTESYNAKSAYGIKGMIEVPELKDGEPNDFLTKLFDQVRKNLAAESVGLNREKEAYEAAMVAGMEIIKKINGPETVEGVMAELAALNHALTSKTELGNMVKSVLKESGIGYNKQTKKYEQKQG